MRKVLQRSTVCILLLLHFNLAPAEATERFSWHFHKQSAQELIDSFSTLFRYESAQTDEKMKKLTWETSLVIEQEAATAIADLNEYHMQLEKEVLKVDKEAVLVKFHAYEEEKKEDITKEVKTEITQYLEELLTK